MTETEKKEEGEFLNRFIEVSDFAADTHPEASEQPDFLFVHQGVNYGMEVTKRFHPVAKQAWPIQQN